MRNMECEPISAQLSESSCEALIDLRIAAQGSLAGKNSVARSCLNINDIEIKGTVMDSMVYSQSEAEKSKTDRTLTTIVQSNDDRSRTLEEKDASGYQEYNE